MAALALPAFGQATALTENQFEPRWKQYSASSAALTKPKECAFVVPSKGSAYQVIVTGSNIPAWVEPTILAFIRVQELSDNWDTYGGRVINRDLISQSLSVLSQIMEPIYPAPSVVPLGDGGLQLEWHRKQQDLEIVFSADDPPQFCYQNRANGVEQEGFATDVLSLAQRLRSIA